MVIGQEFHFLCSDKMAEGMGRIVSLGGGEIFQQDIRSYGVVLSIRKRE